MSQSWSLITVTYNNAETLLGHWGQPLPPGVEWIVVDNASSDGSAEVARSLGAQVIALAENIGFGRANNVGYERSTGEIVAFVNPDVVVDPASLPVIAERLADEPGIVAPQLRYPDGSAQPSGRGLPTFTDKVLSRLGSRAARDRYYIVAEPGESRFVGWLVGAAVVARREIFDRLGDGGPWDPRFFVYYEDCDLGLRAWRAGITVRVLGDASWTHSWARATSSFRIKPWLLEFDGMRSFYSRYPSAFLGIGPNRWWRSLRRGTWGELARTGATR